MVKKKQGCFQVRNNELTEHFKMYKAGKKWVFAGVATLTLGSAILLGNSIDVQADSNNVNTQAVVNQESTNSTNAQQSADTRTQSPVQTDTQNAGVQSTVTADASQNETTGTEDSNANTSNADGTQNPNDTAKDVVTKVSPVKYTYSKKATATQNQVAVGKTTKVYDKNTKTPSKYAVSLSDNLKAPSDWYVTEKSNQYLVSADSGDLDLSKVKQAVGTYSVSISAAGLGKINAANEKLANKLTKDDVSSGALEVTKAPFPNNTIVVKGGSKYYDQKASTDPKSYNVTLPSILKPAAGWTKNSDGSYKVAVSSGDLDAKITSQNPGEYSIELTQSALDKLNAANPDFALTSKSVASGSFQIMTDYYALVGVSVKPKGSMPSSVRVTVKDRTWKVPSDWKISYNNTGQSSIVYNVPVAYFDTSSVDQNTVGNYKAKLSDSTIQQLNDMNAGVKFDRNNTTTGTIVIRDAVSSQSWSPANYGGTINGNANSTITGGDGKSYRQITISEGSSLTMNLTLTNAFGNSQQFKNFTQYLIVPAGFKIATNNKDGNPVGADNPADAIKDAITKTYPADKYTDLTVDQLTSYKGRQTFRIKFGTVQSNIGSVNVKIITDPNSDVTSGWIGSYYASRDSAVLYATDNYADTHGSYYMNAPAYDNILSVANALGIDNAHTLNSSYNGWFYNYQIIKDVKVKDNYQFVDPNGKQIGTNTVTGNPNDSYVTSGIAPETITHGGKTYQLKPGAMNAVNTYPLVNKTITPGTKIVDGTTYKVQYQEVIDPTVVSNQVKANGDTKAWDGQMPSNYTVTVPDTYKVPEGWTQVAGQSGVYKVDPSEIDTSSVKSDIGSYPVQLNAKGLADLAAANDNYLFTNQIAVDGKATITPKLTVKYVDDQKGGQQVSSTDYTDNLNGTYAVQAPENYVLADGQQTSMTYSTTENNPTLTVHLDHKHAIVDNAKTTTDTVHYAGLPKDKQIKDAEVPVSWTSDTDMVTGDVSYTSKSRDTVKVPTVFGYAPDTASVTFDRISTGVPADQTKTVTYKAAQAQLTVTYHDDETGQEVPNTSKVLTGVTDQSGIYSVQVPENYKLADKQAPSVPYTFKGGDDNSDDIVIHLVHDTATSTITTTRDIQYVLKGEGDSTKMPAKISQGSITYNVVTDKVTGLSDATPASQFDKVDSPKVAGYTPDEKTVPVSELAVQKNLTGTQLDALKKASDVIVQYTANKQTVTIHFVFTNGKEAMKDKTITGLTDTSFTSYTPALSGYTADKLKVSGKFSADPAKNVYKVIFALIPYTPVNPDTPTTPVTPSNPVTPTTPTTPANPIPGKPSHLAKNGVVVYALNHIYLYKNPTFNKQERRSFYAKKPRINRPMFVVTGRKASEQGRMRYKVRDVNHGSATFGMTGYITTNAKYVIPVYYGLKHKKVTVINPTGVNAYANKNLTGKVKNYKQGTVLKVYKIVRHNLTTRFYIGNGRYITANKKLVISGTYKQPKAVKTTHTVYKYSDVNLTQRGKRIKKGTVLKVKKWEYSYEKNAQKTGAKRYLVAGGYVTGNSRYVKVIK